MAAEHVERIAVYLAEIAGAPFSRGSFPWLDAARADATVLLDHTRRAFCEWLAGEAALAPLVLVLDDLHCPVDEIKDIAALMTMVDGRVVYRDAAMGGS